MEPPDLAFLPALHFLVVLPIGFIGCIAYTYIVMDANATKHESLSSIARRIREDWSKQGKGVNFAAKPYLDAMGSLDQITDDYGMDSGKSIVAYFLANAGTWRGEVAKEVKKQLNALIK